MRTLPRKKVEALLGRFDRVHILVVGDLMLDRFIWGSVTRISPEAPVPVVEVTSESDVPGGSANVVNNICALGGRVHVCGLIGSDRIGRNLLEKLSHTRIDLTGVILDSRRSTTLKTRIIAHSQQVVRVDKENRAPIRDRETARLLSYIRSLIGRLDAVIIEDYGKGLVTQQLVRELIRLSREHDVILAVDPKRGHVIDYRGITVITPNRTEALWLAGPESSDRVDLDEVGRNLLARLACKGVLITLGEQGMRLFQEGRKPTGIPTAAREVYDVSGAGDTVISAFTLALAAGASMADAAILANYAAGVVVGKVGTATVSRAEIIGAMFS
jgi:D-beta-D-heptose 7-phosphate kinase/D-beta-D-heptose 1-phosphate adenosyltransferase